MIWIDAQLSPAVAAWLNVNFEVEAFALRDLNLRDAEDTEIFLAAKEADAIVVTKDRDFVDLPDASVWVREIRQNEWEK